MNKKDTKDMRAVQALIGDNGDLPLTKRIAQSYVHLLFISSAKELQKHAYSDISNAIQDWIERIK